MPHDNVIEALKTAVAAEGTRPITIEAAIDPNSDHAHWMRSNQVEIAPKDKAAFIAALSDDPVFRYVDGKMCGDHLYGGCGMSLDKVASFMLAQVLDGGNPAEIVHGMAKVINANKETVVVVMTVYDVSVAEPVDLRTRGLSILPVNMLPASMPRAYALDQMPDPYGSRSLRQRHKAAITIDVQLDSVIFDPKVSNHKKWVLERLKRQEELMDIFHEACALLSFINLTPAVPHMIWSYFKNPYARFLNGDSWQTIFDGSQQVSTHEIKPGPTTIWFVKYFAIPDEIRSRRLKIPIQRLARTTKYYPNLDRAIDLGIALESLLIHDNDPKNELSYKVRTRGALLLGGDTETRINNAKLLSEAYNLRSEAVHRGRFRNPQNASKILNKAIHLCGELITAILNKKGIVDWDQITFGGQ